MNRAQIVDLVAGAAILAAILVTGAHSAPESATSATEATPRAFGDEISVSPAPFLYSEDLYAPDENAERDPVAECLIALGYRGRSDDHADMIYAPWRAIESCAGPVSV